MQRLILLESMQKVRYKNFFLTSHQPLSKTKNSQAFGGQIKKSHRKHFLLAQKKIVPGAESAENIIDEGLEVESSSSPIPVAKSKVNWKLRAKGGNFVDFRRITVHGGSGGSGCVSFQRERHLPRGPPNGGNGGHGGNVIFVADKNETTLYSLRTKLAAESGIRGKGKDMHGPNGKDLIVKVPVGTVLTEIDIPKYEFLNNIEITLNKNKRSRRRPKSTVEPREIFDPENPKDYDLFAFGEEESSPEIDSEQTVGQGEIRNIEQLYELYTEEKAGHEKEEMYTFYPRKTSSGQKELMEHLPDEYNVYLHELKTQKPIDFDFNEDGLSLKVAKGGLGGYGNPHFASSTYRSPYLALNGLPGQMRFLELELKTIADVGLVGMPNAGKSTFISSVTNASPKIAPYPFTTLNPYLGTVTLNDSKKVTIADIPGIIKGAHLNKGLGHSFLRHIERSTILGYLVDLSKDEPWNDLETLRYELEMYLPGLTKRPSLVIANKADLSMSSKRNYEAWVKFADLPIIPVSAKNGLNVSKVINTFVYMLDSKQ
ncbi:GTPase Obg [Zancudomyces culisetae]|uniref:GTPase Obg n=1 Tax=Zancudomyces culisetae TaxID=1213189 RepID=A0A1R1PDZ3_ZANCU|nr:GTPase Obg [Zancudomyces culisetae]|eukprot:OMH79204.1 GTPase Obg [Zancudomyces culisetae]